MTASAPVDPDTIAARLLDWYDAHARELPWRSAPGAPPPDPYRVWLSEVMLQQTTVAAVKPYFTQFTARWPDVTALAAAKDDDVMAAWAGLGYYSRARNLVKCAREVAALGGFPANEAELRKLPGLGAYTAAAVAAIAFGQRAVVVDANVERVVSRLFAIEKPLPGSRPTIRAAADAITPHTRPGDFAQAMMDLGSGICTSRNPGCTFCPLATDCAAYRRGDPGRLPIKAPKTARPARVGRAFWICRGDAVWLVQRGGKGMLAGMRALPDDNWTARQDGDAQPPVPGDWQCDWQHLGAVQHVFSHASLTLHVFAMIEGPVDGLDGGVWWPLDEIHKAGLPTLFAKAVRLALAQTD